MGLTIETWSIAYRKKNKSLLDCSGDFSVLKNGHKGWYADPFLFDYSGETYLFAEFFDYKIERGVIVYSKYDKNKGKFEDFKEIIREDYHMSYPLVFVYNKDIYMMPETSESESLFLYKAVNFPDKWEKLSPVMEKIKLVDTTPIVYNDKLYALTLKLNENSNEMLLLEFDGKHFNISSQGILSKDMSVARPGGHFISLDEKLYRVSQDCSKGYGDAINIIEINTEFISEYKEKLIKKIKPQDISLTNMKTADGIHTYNFSEQLEVIDLKYYRKSYYRVLLKVRHKLFGR